MSKARNRVLKILAFLLGCVLGLSIVESSIRIFHLYSQDRLTAPHPRYGVMNIPGASGWFVRGEVRQYITINSCGLRDHESVSYTHLTLPTN